MGNGRESRRRVCEVERGRIVSSTARRFIHASMRHIASIGVGAGPQTMGRRLSRRQFLNRRGMFGEQRLHHPAERKINTAGTCL
jgi:hypothetical protein